MAMLSSSTPDLREDSVSTLAVLLGCWDGGIIHPGSGNLSHRGSIKDIVARPGSAPATKFNDCDSTFEEGGDVDPADDLGDILSVLSVDDDPKSYEIHPETKQDMDSKSVKSLELGTDSNIGQNAGDQNTETDDQKFSRLQPKPLNLGAFRSFIPAIAEMSGEDSDSYSHHSNRLLSPPSGTYTGTNIPSSQSKRAGGLFNSNVAVKPRQVKCLQTPLVCISASDDTSSDSNDEVTQFSLPAIRRKGGGYRRRHSLPTTTPDQITRMLLSQRRSSPGLPIPGEDCLLNMHSKSASNHSRKPMEKQWSAKPDSHKLFPQTHKGPTGRRGSISGPKSPSRVVTPRDDSLSSSTHLRPISPEPLTTTGRDTSQRIASPRPVSPRAVYPSPTNISPRLLSPYPQSPRSRSPGLVRQDRSRSPTSKMMLSVICHHGSDTASPNPRTNSCSPKPKQELHGRLSRRSSYTNDVNESASTKKEPLKTLSSLGNALVIHGKSNQTQCRSPVPYSLNPDHSNSRPASPQPQRARSPRPTGHERRSSRRRSSLADITATANRELTSLSVGSQSRRSSHTPRSPDDSDDCNFEQEMDRRMKRRGSRSKILTVSENQAAFTSRRYARRSSISILHPTQEMASLGPGERADITAKLAKRSGRRSSWAGAGEKLLLQMTPVSALRERNRNADEETDQTRDPYVLTLHFITDPGKSQPLRKILQPLIESIVPKLKLFNFVERSESATQDHEAGGVPDHEKPARVPTLGVVLLLQEEFGMERIMEAQKYLRSEPWELHHRGKVGSNNVPYPTNNQDFYAHQTRLDSVLWAVRQLHFGKDRLRFQLFVSDDMWADSISFYALLLSRSTHVQKEDFCYFLVFCSQNLNLEVQLALKKLPPGFKPQFLGSTILQFKVENMGQLVPLLPRVCIPISDKRWQTADPDGNKVLLFKDGGSCTTPIPHCKHEPPVGAPSREIEIPGHQMQENPGLFDEWIHESNLVSAV